MFQTKLVEKIKTLFLYSVTFFWKSCRLWHNVEKTLYSVEGHVWQYGTCALHAGYLRLQIHTIRLCNTHWFSTATLVAGKHLNVTLYLNCLSCLFYSDYTRRRTLWSPEGGHHGHPGHVRKISEYYPKLDYNRFLPHPLQFSIHHHRHVRHPITKLLPALEHKLQNIRTKDCKLTYNIIKRIIIYVTLQDKKMRTAENVCPFDIRMNDYSATV